MSRCLPVILLLGILSGFAVAADEVDSGLNPIPQEEATSWDALARKIEHLRRAADHLSAAGLTGDAARMRDEARRLARHSDLLQQKEAELDCLLEEIDRLRNETQQPSTILFRVTVLEVSRNKLRNDAQDFDRLFHQPQSPAEEEATEPDVAHPAGRLKFTTGESPMKNRLVTKLIERGVVRVLGEPTLITTNRRPASFMSGGEFPVTAKAANGETIVQPLFTGTKLEIVPNALSERKVRFDIQLRISEPDLANTVTIDGNTYPSVTTRSVHTEIETEMGSAVTIAGLSFCRGRQPTGAPAFLRRLASALAPGLNADDELQMLVVVSPEPANPPRLLPSMPIVPVAAEDDLPVGLRAPDYDPTRFGVFGPPMPVLPRGK
jgi:hypothetical protein